MTKRTTSEQNVVPRSIAMPGETAVEDRSRSPFAISVVLLAIGWCLAITAHAQDGVLNRQTIEATEETFGGIERIVVVSGESRSRIELDEPLDIEDALEKAGVDRQGDAPILCFESTRKAVTSQTRINVSEEPGTLFIGDPDNAPCEVNVLTGQLNVVITVTESWAHFYRLHIHLDADSSCALDLTNFSYDSRKNEAALVWQSIPESRYTVETSIDLKRWEELKRDIPSGGTSTTATLPLAGRSRERYFRVRLQLDSLPEPKLEP